jgi:hypothetical protein
VPPSRAYPRSITVTQVLDYASNPIPKKPAILANPLMWAVFLGMSWTWCIGMYLPVILIRDYGTLGWLVFALPNVIGAALMGWILQRKSQSEELVARHEPACIWFSVVTIAFQLFFIAWMFQPNFLIPVFIAMFCLIALMRVSRTAPLTLAVVVCGISIITAGQLLFADLRWDTPAVKISAEFLTDHPVYKDGLLPLIPVCAFGFLLCPYLDLTFHRVRQATSKNGAKRAFGVGFGFFFLLMIVYTLLYAFAFISHPWAPEFKRVVLFHMATQMAFTIAVHIQELMNGVMQRHPVHRKLILVAVLIFLGLMAGMLVREQNGLPHGETIYRMFMGFYGLVFPAYVWICVVPVPGDDERARARKMFWFAASVIVASPMFWMGFIEKQTMWLLPGVAIVLLARIPVAITRRVITPG